MVYTKHFPIHTFDKLHRSEEYIRDAAKTKMDNQTEGSHLDHLFRYIANDDKTMSKQLVSAYGVIDIEHAYEEFKLTKLQAEYRKKSNYKFDTALGRYIPPNLSDIEKKNLVLARHLIQSFSPEDHLTPEQIHEIGRQTILEFTGGEYEFVIATHVDRDHIHNHIIVNTTNIKTGNALPWKVTKSKSGKTRKDISKEMFEKVSDKIASKYGAKIIEKSPKNSHKKYTMWQTESIYKSKIKSRLDFLLDHSSNIEDFKLKAAALHLHVDFSGKWSTFKLLDEPQVKNTRGRSLSKRHPEKYNQEQIEERLKQNEGVFTVEDVVSQYEEAISRKEKDFDYMVTVEEWQISHSTDKGYYLNVDFGIENRGKLFIGGYKVDKLEEGQYNLFIKRSDYFYFMDDQSSERNRYMTGETLMKQLRLYNGNVPLKKEPVMSTIDEVVSAINFLAENDVSEGHQLTQLEKKLQEVLLEAETTLAELDDKLMELHLLGKRLLSEAVSSFDEDTLTDLKQLIPFVETTDLTFEDVQSEIKSVSTSRDLLKQKFQQTIEKMNQLHMIQAVVDKTETKNNHLSL